MVALYSRIYDDNKNIQMWGEVIALQIRQTAIVHCQVNDENRTFSDLKYMHGAVDASSSGIYNEKEIQ